MATADEVRAALFERIAYHTVSADLTTGLYASQAILLAPNDATAHFARGAAYQALLENDRAIQDYSQAINLAPGFAAAIYLRGSVRKLIGDDKAGDADIARARQIDPTVGK